jgi:hypothetical protein
METYQIFDSNIGHRMPVDHSAMQLGIQNAKLFKTLILNHDGIFDLIIINISDKVDHAKYESLLGLKYFDPLTTDRIQKMFPEYHSDLDPILDTGLKGTIFCSWKLFYQSMVYFKKYFEPDIIRISMNRFLDFLCIRETRIII